MADVYLPAFRTWLENNSGLLAQKRATITQWSDVRDADDKVIVLEMETPGGGGMVRLYEYEAAALPKSQSGFAMAVLGRVEWDADVADLVTHEFHDPQDLEREMDRFVRAMA